MSSQPVRVSAPTSMKITRLEAEFLEALRSELDRQHKTLTGADVHAVVTTVARVVPDADSDVEMDRLVGPFYDTQTLMSWLGVTGQDIDKRIEVGELLACITPDKVSLYPAWQFMEDGQPIPGLGRILPILASGVHAPWTWALWMVSRLPDELDGMSPVEWLTRGRDVNAVETIASQDAAAWAS